MAKADKHVETPATETAKADTHVETPAPGPFVPKITKLLTRPYLVPEVGVPVCVKVITPMETGKQIDSTKPPPIQVNVIRLDTGEEMTLLCGKVIIGIFNDSYPDNAYVGRGFMLTLLAKKKGRSGSEYNPYTVAEIQV